MLRTYKTIAHRILEINNLAYYIVCDYWCNAEKGVTALFDSQFRDFFNKLPSFKEKVVEVYDICRTLTNVERNNIRTAFQNHNDIENLCNGTLLFDTQLHSIVEDKMKPFFVNLYEEYSERKTLETVYSSKMDYYNKLYEENRFVNCPCCCLDSFESDESDKREDFDHYLPKSLIPFASVNYKNLVPLCHKCNRTYKSDSNPIENGKTSFYPYGGINNNIHITIEFDQDIEKNISDLILSGPENDKINTWDEIFLIRDRYINRTNQIKESFLRRLKKRKRRYNLTAEQVCCDFIDEYQQDNDKYEADKFLKIPIMEAILQNQDFIDQLN